MCVLYTTGKEEDDEQIDLLTNKRNTNRYKILQRASYTLFAQKSQKLIFSELELYFLTVKFVRPALQSNQIVPLSELLDLITLSLVGKLDFGRGVSRHSCEQNRNFHTTHFKNSPKPVLPYNDPELFAKQARRRREKEEHKKVLEGKKNE